MSIRDCLTIIFSALKFHNPTSRSVLVGVLVHDHLANHRPNEQSVTAALSVNIHSRMEFLDRIPIVAIGSSNILAVRNGPEIFHAGIDGSGK
jgi:hypothetical protein